MRLLLLTGGNQMHDVENEGDTAVAEDRGPGEMRDVIVQLRHGFDHRLMVADDLVDDQADLAPCRSR